MKGKGKGGGGERANALLEVSLNSSLAFRCQRLQYLFGINARLRNELLRRRSDLDCDLSLDHFRLEGLDDVLEDEDCFLSHCWIRSALTRQCVQKG